MSQRSFNRRNFIFQVVLNNDTGSVNIAGQAIQSLTIIDDMFDLFPSAVIDINNFGDRLESTGTGKFSFRGDGRDFATIHIFPELTSGEIEKDYSDEDNRKKYGFTARFTIVDSESYGGDAAKGRVLYLAHETEQALSENPFGSIIPPVVDDNDPTQMSNTDRMLPISDHIKAAITGAYDGKEDIINKDKWDTSKSSIFYNGYQGSRPLDAINYLLPRCLSSKDCNSILSYDITTGKFNLIPLSTYFENAQEAENNMEYFHTPTQNPSKLGKDVKSLAGNTLNELSTMLEYDLVAPSTSIIIGTDLIGTMSSTPGEAFLHIPRNSWEEIRKGFYEQYGEPLGIKDEKDMLFPLNKRRIEKPTIQGFSLHTTPGVINAMTIPKIFNSYIFGSHAVSFKCVGSLHRIAGNFFNVVVTNGDDEGIFNRKMNGKYFCTRIAHTFTGDSYRNTITGTKLYINDGNKQKDDID
tara:strand:+ start:276 stop:1676 length:1401 start_codon:yes stop_codon:yes gene_type:complete